MTDNVDSMISPSHLVLTSLQINDVATQFHTTTYTCYLLANCF